MTAQKPTVSLGGVPLGGVGPIAWKFQTGVQPYVATYHVHNSVWEARLKHRMGGKLDLVVTDSRGVKTTVRDLYILHTIPGDGPKRTWFVVADRRWRWPYKLIARDYNVTKRSGNRTIDKDTVPVEARVTVDEYTYKPYSLNGNNRWKPEDAVKDILELMEGKDASGSGVAKYNIDSFPLESFGGATGEDGQFTLQNVILRDQSDIALNRLLSYIPGATVYVDSEGVVQIFDGTDLDAVDSYYAALPPNTWDGNKAEFIDRAKIRPKKVRVHYQREVEMVLEYEDDYVGSTSANPVHTDPFVENVCATTDPETTITEFDPEVGAEGASVDKTVPPGTYVNFKSWLTAMDDVKPTGSLKWNFDTIQTFWIEGDLEGRLTGTNLRGKEDGPDTSNVISSISSLRKHFRQTFRINRRFMERIRDIKAQRVALLDPVTGARGPAAVWGEYTIIPTKKGKMVASRANPDKAGTYYMATSLPQGEQSVTKKDPGPHALTIVDADQGIFRIDAMASPYGDIDSIVPSHVVDIQNNVTVPSRNLTDQDDKPMGCGMRLVHGVNECLLAPTTEYKFMVTIVPGAPNNKNQFHVEEVEADSIKDLFRHEFRIQDGVGPELDVFISPAEATARFAWQKDDLARKTIGELLGLNSDDPNDAGITEQELDGFLCVNQQVELYGHSRSVAAEMLAAYADNVQGSVSTIVPPGWAQPDSGGMKLKGNMSGSTLQVAAAPSAKVSVTHEFPGQQKPISRLALMPESVRHLVLGIVPFGKE